MKDGFRVQVLALLRGTDEVKPVLHRATTVTRRSTASTSTPSVESPSEWYRQLPSLPHSRTPHTDSGTWANGSAGTLSSYAACQPNSCGPVVIAVVFGGEAGDARFVPLPVAVNFVDEFAGSGIGWPSWLPSPLAPGWR